MLLSVSLFITALAAFVPLVRTWFRAEVGYNEGWNVFNAMLLAGHHPLYPATFGWTTNNYPMLSFVVMAALHHFTHDYLFTARILSLASLGACALLVGIIVRHLTGMRRPATLSALFCIAVFCADADGYIGMDDPQLFAQVFFLAGLYIALLSWQKIGRACTAHLIASAFLFTIGGSIKHNLIDFPIAVLVALAFVSLRRAAIFAAAGITFAAASIYLNTLYGGPHFLQLLLLPRSYSIVNALENVGVFLGPLTVPLIAAVATAIFSFRDPQRRTISLMLVFSLLIGTYFSGGAGVSMNAFFSILLAISILIGILFAEVDLGAWHLSRYNHLSYLPAAIFAWLMVPMLLSGNWNLVRDVQKIQSDQLHFNQEVALLQNTRGPVLCESLLACYFAGKPYTYDPFNSTRLIQQHKLDESPILNALRNHAYGAVQLDGPINDEDRRDRFTPQILNTLQQNYYPAMQNTDGEIYLPQTGAQAATEKSPSNLQ